VGTEVERIAVDEASFRKMHAADRMATDKLEEGIAGFSKALVALEKLLKERLSALHAAPSK
jgi:transaldolase